MNQQILLKAIVGSRAYGTNLPTSDTDLKGVYIQHLLEVVSFNKYKPQILPDKDTTYWEIERFIELLTNANPTVLELLFSPEDCIIYKHPFFDILLNYKYKFLTKKCKNSLIGYAKQQIYKAKGLNKKMNWEKERIERKLPIDFCKAVSQHGQKPLTEYLETMPNFYHCLTKIDNTNQLYNLWAGVNNSFMKPLCNKDDLLLTAIPKDAYVTHKTVVQYDLDGFQKHCREYNEYQQWLRERNTERYVDVDSHGQQIDGKNLMHCIRLIEMGKELAETGELNIKRPNAQELLKIRRGEYNLQEIIDRTDQLIIDVEDSFNKSLLPDDIDLDFVNSLLQYLRLTSLTDIQWNN